MLAALSLSSLRRSPVSAFSRQNERQCRSRLLGLEPAIEAVNQLPPGKTRKVGFKGASQAARLAARISPKFRRKNKSSTALLQVLSKTFLQVAH